MGLPLPRVAGDGDVEAVRVLDRLGGKGHREALGDDPVADMALVEGVEQERKRVAGPEDCKSPLAVFVRSGRRKDGLLLSLRRPLRLVHPSEFRPALGSSAAGCMVAAGKEGAVRELDGERAVLVGSRERALGEGVEGSALPGAGAPDGDVVREKP